MSATNPQPHRPGKPTTGAPRPKAASNPSPKPGSKSGPPADSFLGWLGRQVGHVKNAVQTDVTKPAKAANSKKPATAKQPAPVPKPAAKAPRASDPAPAGTAASPSAPPKASSTSNGPPSMVVYRNDKIEEAELPDRPGVRLRRTIIDEVIVEKKE